MPKDRKIVKGYLKTENAILLIVVGLAVGFVGGVLFSVHRSAGRLPAAENAASAPLTQQQADTLAALIKQTEEKPDSVSAWTQLGHMYFDTGQPAKAIEAYEKSLALDDKRPDVWTDLGVMYRRNDQPRKAVECFDRALSLDSTHEVAMFNKGVVLMHDLQDPAGALAVWEKLVALNPKAKTPGGQSVAELVAELKKNLSSGE